MAARAGVASPVNCPRVKSTEEFEYLAVLLSIVLGLGVTQLLTGVGRLVQARGRVRPYWPTLAWIAMLLLIHVQAWWAMFELRDHRGWTFAKFLVVLLTPAALYLMAALVLPDVAESTAEGRVLDLQAHYYAQLRWFFGAGAIVIASSLLRPVAMDGRFPVDTDRGIQLVFLGFTVAGAVVRRPRYHEAMTLVGAALLTGYVALLFARLR
jgi:hypothetical protein